MGDTLEALIPPLILVSLCVCILIVYFALSKGSSPLIKRTARIVLILIGIVVVVSVYLILSEPVATLNPKPPSSPENPVPVKVVKTTPVLIVTVLFLLFIAWIVYISLRDQRREEERNRAQRQGALEHKD